MRLDGLASLGPTTAKTVAAAADLEQEQCKAIFTSRRKFSVRGRES